MMILIGVLVVLLTFGGGGFVGYQQGKKIERADWLAAEKKQQAALAKELGEAMQRKTAHEQKELNNLMGVINVKNDAMERLNNDLVHTQRMLIRAKNTTCPAGTLPGQTKGASQHAQAASEPGIRVTGGIQQEILSDESTINREIWRVYEEREKLKAYAESLRGLLVPLVEVVE